MTECRVCGSSRLSSVLDLGVLALTGTFQADGSTVKRAPLELVLCGGSCGLLQLREPVARKELFGDEYGYQSSINATMRSHLAHIVERVSERVILCPHDVVLDIGSNDGTLLDNFPKELTRIGIDPSGRKFAQNYQDKKLIVGFFDRHTFKRRAKVITSIAMFYDLERPLSFMHAIAQSLTTDGVWVTEQSYMPTMIANASYDTVCHEHIEYYGLRQIQYMARRADLRIVDVTLNDINGGSFCVTLCHERAPHKSNVSAIQVFLEHESAFTPKDYALFAMRVSRRAALLRDRIGQIESAGGLVLGYGASTKGNVILQYCGIRLKAVAERNPAKFGLRTPGTNIPIISEEEARAMKPDYFLVLPWHFRKEIEEREHGFLAGGGRFIYPLGAAA